MDSDRVSWNQQALHDAHFNAVVCALPSNVLLMSGYWSVVGTSIAICACDGPTVLLVPEDEVDLAQDSYADSIETFVPETLENVSRVSQAVKPQLVEILQKLKLNSGRIGVESGPSFEAASYLSLHLYGDELLAMLKECLPNATFAPINEWMRTVRSVKTTMELVKIRQACAIAKNAFETGAPTLHAGMSEPEAAQSFRALLTKETTGPLIQRSDGFAFCMSGPNSGKAYAAYARSRQRRLEKNDLVMIHCNSYVDGFWTDITRTYTLQTPDKKHEGMYSAVFSARQAALSCIKPGVRAAVVDAMARHAIQDCWLGYSIKHGTGHGVGLSAMSAYSIPRIHSSSPDILQEGMVFNVEPAVYIEQYGGVRHCDMVAVTKEGYELLTQFQSEVKSLTVPNRNLVGGSQIGSGSSF